uniref:tRNA-guanine(15) transglycosylase-like domain-containing protein n=1 Tax=Piliocolobus tephrosceles TaxID=591936 RepID=A0A8C9HKP0_9PRIM
MKSTPIDFIKKSDTQIILSNTFHLLIQPKPHVVFQLGGLHKFMNWDGPILTDSGGYQLFSMAYGTVSNEIKRKNNTSVNESVKKKKKNVKIREHNSTNICITDTITSKDKNSFSDNKNSFSNNKNSFSEDKNNFSEDKNNFSEDKNNFSEDKNNFSEDKKKISKKKMDINNTTVTDDDDNDIKNINNKIIIKINEEGAVYKSYYDGSTNVLTPELSIQSQYLLGSDLIVVLDECTPYNVSKEYTEKSMHRSHRWYIRCLSEFYKINHMLNYNNYLYKLYNKTCKSDIKWDVLVKKKKQALYGIIQGGIYEDLRKKSCDFVCSLPFFGICIGGSLGVNKEMMYSVINDTMNYLSQNIENKTKKKKRPIHLLGIGKIKDIFYGVKQGIDTFDCVIPTRLARHGYFLCNVQTIQNIEKILCRNVNNEYIKIKLNIFKTDSKPLETCCSCYTCTNYTRAYLHHLYKINDNLLGTLLTVHNVSYMNRLMKEIRVGIKNETLDQVEQKWTKQ